MSMITDRFDRLLSYLDRTAGPTLRWVVGYDADEWEILRARSDVRERYSEDQAETLMAAFRDRPTIQEIRDRIDAGDTLRCEVFLWDTHVTLHFPAGSSAGVVVSLDPEAAADLHDFAEHCRAPFDDPNGPARRRRATLEDQIRTDVRGPDQMLEVPIRRPRPRSVDRWTDVVHPLVAGEPGSDPSCIDPGGTPASTIGSGRRVGSLADGPTADPGAVRPRSRGPGRPSGRSAPGSRLNGAKTLPPIGIEPGRETMPSTVPDARTVSVGGGVLYAMAVLSWTFSAGVRFASRDPASVAIGPGYAFAGTFLAAAVPLYLCLRLSLVTPSIATVWILARTVHQWLYGTHPHPLSSYLTVWPILVAFAVGIGAIEALLRIGLDRGFGRFGLRSLV